MKHLVLLSLLLLSITFASPANVKHAALFEPYVKYQKSWINRYRVYKGNAPAQARLMREMLAKKAEYESKLGKDLGEYAVKHKSLCVTAFLYTAMSFDNLMFWAGDYRQGQDNPSLFKTEIRKAETGIRDCKAL